MERTGYAAMAKLAMHQREYTVIIRAREHGLTMHTIYYPNEVREVPGYGTTSDIEVKPQEIQLAEQLIKSLAAKFEPDKYEDAYQKRVLELIEAKSEGRTIKETKTKKLAPVIDLMAALQRSLEQGADAERRPARAAATTKTPAKRSARAARKAS
jgi:DNA end-binding protein Ku